VINLPGPRHWAAVERLAPLTGSDPVPPHKQGAFRFEPAKYEAAGLHPEHFRHYFGLGPELGHSFRSETPGDA
jgi:hypothetical protein